MTSRPHRPATRAAAVLCLLPLAACSEQNPLEREGPRVAGQGPAAANEYVTDDISLTDVEIEWPEDGLYEVGENASLYFAVTNDGPEPVALTDISGPDFAGVELTGADGGFPLVVPEDDNTYVGAADEPNVTLLDLETDLRSSQSIPITFTFEEAGEVTLEVPVAATPRENEDPDVDFQEPVDEDPTDDN